MMWSRKKTLEAGVENQDVTIHIWNNLEVSRLKAAAVLML